MSVLKPLTGVASLGLKVQAGMSVLKPLTGIETMADWWAVGRNLRMPVLKATGGR
jgi:hypothetical protein